MSKREGKAVEYPNHTPWVCNECVDPDCCAAPGTGLAGLFVAVILGGIVAGGVGISGGGWLAVIGAFYLSGLIAFVGFLVWIFLRSP